MNNYYLTSVTSNLIHMCVRLGTAYNCLIKRKNACLIFHLSQFSKVAKYILKIAKFVARCFLEEKKVARVV